MRPVVLLTMAGRSERFGRAGVDVPKWSLVLGGRSMLERALDSLAPLLKTGVDLRLIVRPADADSPLLTDILRRYPFPARIVPSDGRARGQAVDALGGIGHGEEDRPCIVWCVDTFVRWCDETAAALVRAEGNWLLTAPLSGEQWAFAAATSAGEVTATAEKRRIGPDASVGMYGFGSCQVFRDAVAAVADSQAEVYVAPVYNVILGDGGRVRLVRISDEAVTSVGTPAEMLAACSRHGWKVPPELRNYAEQRRPVS